MSNETVTFKTCSEDSFINITVNKTDYDEYIKHKKELIAKLVSKAVLVEDTDY